MFKFYNEKLKPVKEEKQERRRKRDGTHLKRSALRRDIWRPKVKVSQKCGAKRANHEFSQY